MMTMTESMRKKPDFWQGLTVSAVAAAVSIAVTVGGWLYFAGGQAQRLTEVENKQRALETQNETKIQLIDTRLRTIEQRMISKEDLKEFKEDIRQLIQHRGR